MPKEKFSVRILKGKSRQKNYALGKEITQVGSDDSCDIQLTGAGVSPIHFIIQQSNDDCILVRKGDLPVRVDGVEVQQVLLPPGCKIEFGKCSLSFDSSTAPKKKAKARASSDEDKKSKMPLYVAAGVVYGLMMVMGGLVFMGVFDVQGAQTANLGMRLESLDSAMAASELPPELKEEVGELIRTTLLQESRVSNGLTVGKFRSSLELTATIDEDLYSERDFKADPLRQFILQQINRLGR